VVSVPVSAPPPFVRLAGHPLRWRLLGELARSDRRVRELVALVDQPQNLVSYHLRKLRDAGLVGARRSSFDARDAYYHLNLASCAEALAAAGPALHPGLRLARIPAAPPEHSWRVLFLCTGNSARSPVAEALLRQQSDKAEVTSAGSRPKPLHPNTVRVMRGYGIDLAGREPQHLSTLEGQRFDYVITLCDRVREVCPEFPGAGRQLHWSIPDPAAASTAGQDTYPAFERMAAELNERIGFLLAALSATPAHASLQEA
jgi:protein-tyrosine-phosphatase/DNA-binding transcriptional ArsR family regulator